MSAEDAADERDPRAPIEVAGTVAAMLATQAADAVPVGTFSPAAPAKAA